jgi:hypothetical protein
VKKSMSIGTLFLLLTIAIQSNAEMRITEGGVTFPDSSVQTKAVSGGGISAPLNLSGNLSTVDFIEASDGAIISGVNVYSGGLFAYGGYFEASSRGVYGAATGTSGRGVAGAATGDFGLGVYGAATGTLGTGVHGAATGTSGKGVAGHANMTGNITNYGGYFWASGNSGRGVYGIASYIGNATNYGGYFEASGNSGRGVYGIVTGTAALGVAGESSGTNGTGVTGYAPGAAGRGVGGWGQEWNFFATGPGADYGPFTGAHEVKFAQDMPDEIVPGMIFSVSGRTEERKDENGVISLSSTLPTVTISTKPKDKTVFGVVVSDGPLHKEHWYDAEEGERFGVVNALGEGRVWVTNINGKIEAGDYITTSYVPGYGQLQDDDLLHSYTLGKAIETIDWEQVTETVQHDGRTYKRYLIAVVYTSG